jgi:hypothetical protein
MTKAPSRGRRAGPPAGRRQARAARLAAALKANLHRRKAQARSRAGEPDGAEADAAQESEQSQSERPRESEQPRELGEPDNAQGPAAAPHIGAAIVEDKRTG